MRRGSIVERLAAFQRCSTASATPGATTSRCTDAVTWVVSGGMTGIEAARRLCPRPSDHGR